MKAYTDIEQSKKLAEFLPLESSDMYWWPSGKRYYIEAMDDGDFNEEEGHIRAWSLAALYSVLPTFTLDSSDDKYFRIHCCNKFSEWYNNPVDACVAMIEKLHEQNIL